MSSAWLLPEHIADVLPAQARKLEELRRAWLDTARSFGYELVQPPLLEYLDSLLSGSGHALDLQTFKLVDQLSGRSMGLRADTTVQVARIDAHLLNRQGVTRLCYCGPVLHTRAAGLQSGRELLQMGAEIYGHAGLEADLEAMELAIDGLRASGLSELVVDVADVRLLEGVLQALQIPASQGVSHQALVAAMASKDMGQIREMAHAQDWPQAQASVQALELLARLYGDASVLEQAAQGLPAHPLIDAALHDLRWMAEHAPQGAGLRFGFDLADLSGYGYYSGTRFAIYVPGMADALVRGGRYDEVGAKFGRRRPAVGFSLDLRALGQWIEGTSQAQPRMAILAPWGQQERLRQAIRALRAQGHTVLCALPGHDSTADEFECDRELRLIDGRWQVCPLADLPEPLAL